MSKKYLISLNDHYVEILEHFVKAINESNEEKKIYAKVTPTSYIKWTLIGDLDVVEYNMMKYGSYKEFIEKRP